MSHPKFQIYRDKRGEWRWRLLARNRKIVADSGEGYKTKQGVKRILSKLSWIVDNALMNVEQVP